VVEDDDGNLLEELSRREEATVACDDAGLGINQYRVIETEFGDAGGDLRDLGVRVRPGISGIRDELLDQPVLDPLGHPMKVHRNDCTF
jgi:hypothetical protein